MRMCGCFCLCACAPIVRIEFANSLLWAVFFEGACEVRDFVPLWAVFFEEFVFEASSLCELSSRLHRCGRCFVCPCPCVRVRVSVYAHVRMLLLVCLCTHSAN